MLGRDVRDFVADDRRQLMLVLGDFQQSAQHADLAAGHRERIDRLALEDGELPLDVVVRRFEHTDDGLRHAGDEVDRLAVGNKRHAGGHLVERPVRLGEVFSTIYKNCGIDSTTLQYQDLAGRPTYLVDPNCKPIPELVG